jgi:adenylate cyclase
VTEAKPAEPKKRSSFALLALGFAALVVLIAAGAWYFLGANRAGLVTTMAPAPVASNAAPAEPAHLSIVVLPFTNLSGDPSQDYFADGITDNLTTKLSRIRDSFVIARNTARPFAALQDRPDERVGSARKRSSAEGVGCASSGRS